MSECSGPECSEFHGISQLQDLLNVVRFRDIILAGINTAEKWLDEGDAAIKVGQFDQAEELWKKAFDNLRWIALNLIQRRLRIGKNEGAEVRGRFRNFWRRLMIFGLKRKLAAATVTAAGKA